MVKTLLAHRWPQRSTKTGTAVWGASQSLPRITSFRHPDFTSCAQHRGAIPAAADARMMLLARTASGRLASRWRLISTLGGGASPGLCIDSDCAPSRGWRQRTPSTRACLRIWRWCRTIFETALCVQTAHASPRPHKAHRTVYFVLVGNLWRRCWRRGETQPDQIRRLSAQQADRPVGPIAQRRLCFFDTSLYLRTDVAAPVQDAQCDGAGEPAVPSIIAFAERHEPSLRTIIVPKRAAP